MGISRPSCNEACPGLGNCIHYDWFIYNGRLHSHLEVRKSSFLEGKRPAKGGKIHKLGVIVSFSTAVHRALKAEPVVADARKDSEVEFHFPLCIGNGGIKRV